MKIEHELKGKKIIHKIVTKPEIDIEEAQKDITELLVIDSEDVTRGKIGGFATRYELNPGYHYSDIGSIVADFEKKYNLNVKFDKEGKVIITKPETTENYHHIPINPTCKITATITISASQGIKATYCGAVKKIHTYLFDVKKWTMEKAQAWVKENHKGIEECIQEYFTKGIIPEKEEHKEIIKSMIEDADEKLFKKTETVGELTDEVNKEEVEKEVEEKTEKKERSGRESGPEKKEALRANVSDELEEPKATGIGIEAKEISKEKFNNFLAKTIKVDVSLADMKEWQGVMKNMQEELREIKEGRVLSRKNRKIVKDAITALNAVLKADATGSREDEESASGTVTEREIEIERESEREFSKEDIAKVVKEVSGEQMGEILKGAFEKALNPEKMKAMVGEGIKLELDKLRGKVT